MKKIIYSILPLAFVLALSSCADEGGDIGFDESTPGVNFRMIADETNINLLNTEAEVNLTTYSENDNIDNVTILVELDQAGDVTPRSVLKVISGSELNKNGVVFTLGLDDMAAAVGTTTDALGGGDVFTITNVVTLDNGLVFPDTLTLTDATGTKTVINLGNVFGAGAPTSYTLQLAFTLVCPSAIPEGTYHAVSSGTSTDGCPPTNPLNNYAFDVEITKTAPTAYEVSDIFAGVYINWYGDCYGYDFETAESFNDVCNTVVIDFIDGFGARVQGTGSYDPGTGVITYTWENDFGDTATTTLTPD
jgi:hypothetical protein